MDDTAKLRVAMLGSGLEASPHSDGFGARYRLLTRFLAEECDELLVVFRETGGGESSRDLESAPAGVATTTIAIAQESNSRSYRLSSAIRSLSGFPVPHEWMQQLERQLRDWWPDVIVAPAYESRMNVRPPSGIAPTVLFVEEDPRPYGAVATSTPGKALQSLELWAERRVSAPPAAVVVISERERDWAQHRFPRSAVFVVPHNLDDAYWRASPDTGDPMSGADVFTVCRLDHERNTSGIAQVSRALSRMASRGVRVPRLVLASNDQPHPIFGSAAHELIDFLGPIADPRPYYRSAGATLVPSFVVSGAKTTILQGWATHCAVVTTTAAATSVGGTPGDDLIAGDSPEAVAELLVRTLADPIGSRNVAERGYARYQTIHSEAAVRETLRTVVTTAANSAPLKPSLLADARAERAFRRERLAR
jgi:hypothetical protein